MAIQPEKASLLSSSGPASAQYATVTEGKSAPKPKAALNRSAGQPVSADQRQLMISEAAYYIAERRGFDAGHELDDWLLAERQIDTTLAP